MLFAKASITLAIAHIKLLQLVLTCEAAVEHVLMWLLFSVYRYANICHVFAGVFSRSKSSDSVVSQAENLLR